MRHRAPSASARPDSNLWEESSSNVLNFVIVEKAELFSDQFQDQQLLSHKGTSGYSCRYSQHETPQSHHQGQSMCKNLISSNSEELQMDWTTYQSVTWWQIGTCLEQGLGAGPVVHQVQERRQALEGTLASGLLYCCCYCCCAGVSRKRVSLLLRLRFRTILQIQILRPKTFNTSSHVT